MTGKRTMAYQYANRQEAFLAKLKGKTGKISDKTHEEHLKLYTGYVNKTNAILKELEELSKVLDPANPAHANQIFSTIRSLKVDFTFAIGGVINHEIYFSILGGAGGPATGQVAELIDKSFGGFEAYKKDLKATGLAARGWVWTGYDPGTGLLFNYLGDAQNTYPVWGVKPILALDTYEHAYYADFYTNRGAYLDEFMQHVDWAEVNRLLADKGSR
ncbi:MAG TPA: Fe-Mn family superoxide dismutase [Candidatus Paceibacterota bacterium]|nr:Fe-Mn family superoxide dismutase [Verrucomicrobiota bacterium]HRY47999.1 Fe-Mn family superoxide dismutase [Candidatus Paceibacterota bacterium]HRZ99295.1 Fe-Mn family superoxide dismutase [Candidatus Paceibacterota bacterium]